MAAQLLDRTRMPIGSPSGRLQAPGAPSSEGESFSLAFALGDERPSVHSSLWQIRGLDSNQVGECRSAGPASGSAIPVSTSQRQCCRLDHIRCLVLQLQLVSSWFVRGCAMLRCKSLLTRELVAEDLLLLLESCTTCRPWTTTLSPEGAAWSAQICHLSVLTRSIFVCC